MKYCDADITWFYRCTALKLLKPLSRLLAHAAMITLALLFEIGVGAADPTKILIKDVHLIDRQGIVEDFVVNILITDGKLDVVTQDEIAPQAAWIVVNAQSGYILGSLDMGEKPSFLILSEDPRGNLSILMDSKPYVRFAVENGEIIKNDLPPVATTPVEEQPSTTGWLSYEPPPLAIPLDYHDTTRWNRWEGKYISGLLAGALMLDRNWWHDQDAASLSQVGDLQEFEGGEIRGLRLGAVGTLNFHKPWIYTVFLATNTFDKGFDTTTDDELTWFDYRLDIPLFADTALSIGKQKAPISMERIMSLAYEPLQERSAAADAMLPSRSLGAVVNGTVLNQRLAWAGGVFNDWLDSGESFDDSDDVLVGRVIGTPFLSPDESNLLHLGFGVRHTDAKQGVQYRTEPEVDQAPLFADTGLVMADDALTYNVEATWRKGPFWLAYEYIRSDVESGEFGDLRFDGQHITASWALTGEMRPYRKRSGTLGALPVAKSVHQGGWGSWEAALRYSTLDLTDGPIDGGDLDIYTLGLNWWLTSYALFNLNYRHITLDRFGVEGNSNAVTGRLMLILE